MRELRCTAAITGAKVKIRLQNARGNRGGHLLMTHHTKYATHASPTQSWSPTISSLIIGVGKCILATIVSLPSGWTASP